MKLGHHEATWVDSGREPQQAPNPDYPKGIDVDLSQGGEITCTVGLPYPARRIGYWHIVCERCGMKVAVTTAGRPDDPRSAKVPCKIAGTA